MPTNYYNYFDICKFENIPTGTAKEAIGRGGVEGISVINKLKPIAHQFKEFPKYENGTLRSQYGILKSHYDYWKRTGEPRKQSPGRPPKWKDNPNLVNINIPFPKDLYEEFKDIIDTANDVSIVKYSYRDMFAVAVKEFVDRRGNIK